MKHEHPAGVGGTDPRSTELSCLEYDNLTVIEQGIGYFHDVGPLLELPLTPNNTFLQLGPLLDKDKIEEILKVPRRKLLLCRLTQ